MRFAAAILAAICVFSLITSAADTKPGELIKDPAPPSTKPAFAPRDRSGEEKLGWKLGGQAYTFRNRTTYETIDQLAQLGLGYIEFYPNQPLSKDDKSKTDHNMSDEQIAALKKKLETAGVKPLHYGVIPLGNDEKADRKVFEFVKKMGMNAIVSEPEPGSAELIDKLCEEYGINVAIHNHPQPSLYWNPDTILEYCKGRSKRIGSCADVGHWQRSGINPVEALKKLEGRVICLHFKDLNEFGDPKAHDVTWGTGKGDAAGMLAELKRQNSNFEFAIEYETLSPELASNVAKCIEWFDKETAKLAGTAK